MFIPQMANHAAPWEDENGWTHSNCPVGYRFPEMLCNLSRYLGHPQCPEYISKVVLENEAQVYRVYIHLAPHPERAQYLQETARTLREAYELVAHEAIAELCERHSAQLGNAPASFLPIRDPADMPWRLRYQEMQEYQAEVAAHPARFGRDITGAQLALTAEYALNVFNLQLHQKLEIQYLKHKVGQLQNANATLTEELGAAQGQNADLQIAVAELDNQLQQLLLNDGINQQIGANAEEDEPEEEPSEVQGESGVASGFVGEPGHVDGVHVMPADELSDAESSVNQPVPAAQ